jgi:hypothetical protein
MYEQTVGEAAMQLEPHSGWLNWALQHPGLVALGALALAILALANSSATGDSDSADKDVPLFI